MVTRPFIAEYHARRTARSALWARSIAWFSAILFLLAAAGHRYALIETVAFFWILGLVFALAVLALLLAGHGFLRLWERGERAGKASLSALLVAGAVLSPFLAVGYFALTLPALNDISTDLRDPPVLTHAAWARGEDENAVTSIGGHAAALQVEAYPHVAGRRLDGEYDRVMDAVAAVLATRGWKLHPPHRFDGVDEVTIEAYAPSWLLRMPADASIRVVGDGPSTYVDMRMSTRHGRHDLGENARRIVRFMADLDAEFTRQSTAIIDIPASPEGEDPVD